ncbi:class I SAM-dependent methyltransferase [Sutcliffiella halmapala]|uniref:class I SAM-dependent methyltransferase n=1 Tax=Sutcliffiella halmapala TaxID=79882 RepID=UPI0009954C11|nr:SAM-dependent methyltransferase [Sutcliffiella halmapala]
MIPAFLKERITNTAQRKITYADYMAEVLYHPKHGYYMKEKEKVGAKGDFLTSSNVSDMYGKLFAGLFINYFKKNAIQPMICEIGGGTGRFAKQLLEEWKKIDETFYQSVIYNMIETSPFHLKCQKELLVNEENVHYYSSLEDIPQTQMEGIVFSNELFDAFPVHVVERKDGEIMEVFVTLNEADTLEECIGNVSTQRILEYISFHQLKLKEGQRVEVPLAMEEYAKKLSGFLEKGSIITVDYGYTFAELALPEHVEGSLRGYYQHTLVTDPLQHPSEMDLTTHIHINALEAVFETEGLTPVCQKRQGDFLVEAGILTYLQENFDSNPFSEKSKRNRAIRSLILDSGWSQSFQILIHEKNIKNSWNGIIDPCNVKKNCTMDNEKVEC